MKVDGKPLAHTDQTGKLLQNKVQVINCQNAEQARKLATLLAKYGSVFSTGDDDMGRTPLMDLSIPVKDGTRLIRQTPYRLGPKKEAKA